MDLVFAILTDVHFGPAASHDGKLRKLTARAPELTDAFVRAMNEHVRPDLVFNLGDDIEDESVAMDRERYGACMAALSRCDAPVHHVAGNHDLVHLSEGDLLRAWNGPNRLYYAFDHGGAHFVVLHTQETRDTCVRIDDQQLAWLEADLAVASAPVVVLMHHTATEQDLRGNRWFERAPHLCKIVERRRLRRALEASGKVLAVFNGHLHWNHFDLCGGIPYVTVQSLIENLDDDAPGRAAEAHAVCRLSDDRLIVEIRGNDPARYQIERAPLGSAR